MGLLWWGSRRSYQRVLCPELLRVGWCRRLATLVVFLRGLHMMFILTMILCGMRTTCFGMPM